MNPLSALLVGILLSILPIVELRGGIPFAIANGASAVPVLIFCTLANIIIIPFIFLFLDHAHKHLMKLGLYRKTFNAFLRRIRKRKQRIEKAYQTYGIIVLTFFVAIPLPITGAWTGSIIAWLINLKRRRSFLAVMLGVIIAGIIITLVATGIITAFRFFL